MHAEAAVRGDNGRFRLSTDSLYVGISFFVCLFFFVSLSLYVWVIVYLPKDCPLCVYFVRMFVCMYVC